MGVFETLIRISSFSFALLVYKEMFAERFNSMKHTRHTQPFTRVAATTAVAALATMGLAVPAANAEGGGAKDLFADNTHNLAGGGGV